MRLASVAVLVREYDEAIRFFVDALQFVCIEDTVLPGGKRWVRLGSASGCGPTLTLSRAATSEQLCRVGDQAGGRVFLFIHTDDLKRDYERLVSRGVEFLEAPRSESYGAVAVFRDLYGNRWDLIQPADPMLSSR